jgi:hypothetical protein
MDGYETSVRRAGAGRDLLVETRWTDDDESPGGFVTDDSEVVRPVTRNKDELTGRRRPWHAITCTLQPTLQHVEHFVLKQTPGGSVDARG